MALVGAMNTHANNPDSLILRTVKARATDAQINFELQNHQVFINPTCPQKNKLLLHLVGTFDNPASTALFPSLAANNGFKAISLKYPNNISATTVCKNSTDPACFKKYRQEIIFGDDSSSQVNVNKINCIVNRTTKLLIYLNNTFPSEGWDVFLTQTNEIKWQNVTISGHSQGGGHAAYLGQVFKTNRIIMFASPNDYSATYSRPALWLSETSLTADSNYYAFGNLYDEVVSFSLQYPIWKAIGIHQFGDSFNIDGQNCPYRNSRILYTADTSQSSRIAGNHNNVVIDDYTPKTNNQADFTQAWKYLLGICDNSMNNAYKFSNNLISIYPNPAIKTFNVRTKQRAEQIIVFSVKGEMLQSITPQSTNIPISIAETGLYIIQVQFQGEIVMKQLIIE
jgi:hypothetical protein